MTSSRANPVKAETRLPAKAAWQFIEASKLHDDKNPELRKLVRANAMRDYRRKQKETEKKHKPPAANSPHLPGSVSPSTPTVASSSADEPDLVYLQPDIGLQDRAFHWPTEWESTLLEVEGHTGSRVSSPGLIAAVSSGVRNGDDARVYRPSSKPLVDSKLALRASPGNGNRDPFDSLPSSTHDALELMQHFGYIFRSKARLGNTGEPSALVTVWIPLTMNDPVLFQASINFAAIHRDALLSHRDQPKTLMRKAQTINMVNSRLRCPDAAITDASLGAVCLLAAMERMNGNIEELRLHIAALKRMVEMRGGIEALTGADGVLRMFITWEDMLSAIALSAPPLFPHAPCCTMVRVPLLYPNMRKPELEADPFYNADLLSIFPTISKLATCILRPNCYQDMENLSSQLLGTMDAANTNLLSSPKSFYDFTADEIKRHTQERRHIEHQLRSMRHLEDIPESGQSPLDYTREAARLGCLVYLNTVLSRNLTQPLSILMKLTSQTITLIETAARKNIIDLHRHHPPGSFIWLLCLGGILPLTEEQEAWFAQRIVDVTGQCDTFRDFAKGDHGSRSVCWDSNLMTSPVRHLWQKVESIWKKERNERANGEG